MNPDFTPGMMFVFRADGMFGLLCVAGRPALLRSDAGTGCAPLRNAGRPPLVFDAGIVGSDASDCGMGCGPVFVEGRLPLLLIAGIPLLLFNDCGTGTGPLLNAGIVPLLFAAGNGPLALAGGC